MQKKTFDPRSSKVTNPFVQAYLEKQESKTKPIGEKQSIVNVIFAAMITLNIAVLGIVAWSTRAAIVPHVTSGGVENAEVVGDAVARIKQLEITLQNMRGSLEFHKNAYFRLEQEHETIKATLARTVPGDNVRETLSNYPNPQSVSNSTAQTADATSAQAVQAAHDAAVAAQQLPVPNGQ